MTDGERQLLNRYHPYYSGLDPRLKHIFEQRLDAFRASKTFMRNGGGKVPDEVILMVSATAIQISFGLDKFLFPHFKTIIIYPETYTSPTLNAKSKGEVNPKGALILSWADFLEGNNNYQDGYNVGLHEMAHMLILENLIRNQDYMFLSQNHLHKWLGQADTFMKTYSGGAKKLLRKYALSDMHEMFAVSIEAFFEKASEFKAAQPDMFETLCSLLGQDPGNGFFPLLGNPKEEERE